VGGLSREDKSPGSRFEIRTASSNPFKSFKPFNRFATFKTFEEENTVPIVPVVPMVSNVSGMGSEAEESLGHKKRGIAAIKCAEGFLNRRQRTSD